MSITVMKQKPDSFEALQLVAELSADKSISEKEANILRTAIASAQEQEPYCWTWDEWVRGGLWRAEFGWKKPERDDIANLQPLYTKEQP